MVDLLLYVINLSFHDKTGSNEEDKEPEDPGKAFYTLIPSFPSRYEEYNLLLPVLRNVCSLTDPFVY